MLVKCRDCGNRIDKSSAFRVVVGDKNTYYCNEAEYTEILKQRELKDNTYSTINNIFGYVVTNTQIYKEISSLVEVYGYETVLDYLKENFDYLFDVIHRPFKNEYGKIRYFATILSNTLHDFQENNIPQDEPIKKIVAIDDYKAKYKRKKKRRSMEEIEQEDGE